MLAIARGLMSVPEILILELSLGLSPKLTLEIFETIKELKEQNVLRLRLRDD